MTICIGALCCDRDGNPSRAAVVASDRMVTFGGITEFEHEIPKIIPITDRIVALTAGDALRGSRVVREVIPQLPGGIPSVRAVVELIAASYGELRRQQINNDIFAPRSMDLQQFYSGGQQRLIQMLAGSLDEQVANFNYGVELLIAGTDESGAHLHSIGNPGGSNNDFHQIGFHAIGSGMLHALQSIIGFGHTGKKPLGETIFAVYASKRRAEVAPGVGHDTDLAVITDTGTEWTTSKQLDLLREIYDKHQKAADDQLKKEIGQLDILKKPEAPKEGGEQHDATG